MCKKFKKKMFPKRKTKCGIVLYENITGYEYFELTGNDVRRWDEEYMRKEIYGDDR